MPWGIDIEEAPCRAAPGETLAPVRARVIAYGGDAESAQTETRANGPASVEILDGPPGATLGGTLVRPITNGLVAFDDLTVDLAGAVRLAISANLSDIGLGAQHLPSDANVIEHYYFAESSQTSAAIDQKGGAGLPAFGSPLVVAGLIDTARFLVNTGQYFQRATGNTTLLNTLEDEFTCDALVNITSAASSPFLFVVGTSNAPSQPVFAMQVLSDGTLRYNHRTGDNAEGNTSVGVESAPGTLTYQSWFLLTISRKAISPYLSAASPGEAIVKLYVNGRKVAEATTGMPKRRNDSAAIVGRWHSGSNQWFGTINELRLSRVVRSDAEILAGAKAMGLA